MHESLKKFAPYIEKGLIRKVISPCEKLVLYNYCDKCTYERAWDEVTLNARGTVYEISSGKVIARAFPKFFNFGENSPEKQKEILASKSFETFEKMDGSLGIVYYYDGSWRVNTRGSFTSDQAVKGKEMLKKYDMQLSDATVTYLVEIVYPDNKIIVDYGSSEHLVLLGSLANDSGVDSEGCYRMAKVATKMPHADTYTFDSIAALQEHLATLDHTEEGYVVRLANGERVKFKSAAYLDVARIMSHMSPLAFWRCMEKGKVVSEYLEHLPEEFREECDAMVAEIEKQYSSLKIKLELDFMEHLREGVIGRKEIALKSKEKGLNLSAMFAILDGKGDVLDKIIMKEISPVGNVMKEV